MKIGSHRYIRWKKRNEILEYGVYIKKKKYKKTVDVLLALSLVLLLFGFANRIIVFLQKDLEPMFDKVDRATSISGTYERILRVHGYRQAPYYELKINESSEKYVLNSTLTQCFKYDLFVDYMEPGSAITLVISNTKTLSGNIPVYAVSTGEISFLSVEDTVKAYEENAKFGELLGWSCVVIGLISTSIVLLVIRPLLIR